MTPDELKSIPKGQFVVMKTGSHPMRTRLRLFLDWGITFEEPYILEEQILKRNFPFVVSIDYIGNADLIPPNDKRCDKIGERGRGV